MKNPQINITNDIDGYYVRLAWHKEDSESMFNLMMRYVEKIGLMNLADDIYLTHTGKHLTNKTP